MKLTAIQMLVFSAGLGLSWTTTLASAEPEASSPQVVTPDTDSASDLSSARKEKLRWLVDMTTASTQNTEILLHLDPDSWAGEMYATGEGMVPLFESGEQLVEAVEIAAKSGSLTERQEAALWVGAMLIDFHSTQISAMTRRDMLLRAINAASSDPRLCRRLCEFAWNYSLIYVHIDAANTIAQRAKAHDNVDVRAIGLTLEARVLGANGETDRATAQLRDAFAMAQDKQVKAKVAAWLFDHIYAPTGMNASTVQECAIVAQSLSLPAEIRAEEDGSLELARVLNSARVLGKVDLEMAPSSLEWILDVLPMNDARRANFLHLRALLPGRSQVDLMSDFTVATFAGPPQRRIQLIEIYVRHFLRSDFAEFRTLQTNYNDNFIATHRGSPIGSVDRRFAALYMLHRAEVHRQLGHLAQARATAQDACELAEGDLSLDLVSDIYANRLADQK